MAFWNYFKHWNTNRIINTPFSFLYFSLHFHLSKEIISKDTNEWAKNTFYVNYCFLSYDPILILRRVFYKNVPTPNLGELHHIFTSYSFRCISWLNKLVNVFAARYLYHCWNTWFKCLYCCSLIICMYNVKRDPKEY